MPNYSAPLVGMAFRPPAKDVVTLLPAGAKLHLVREPDNPHDTHAVKVLLPDFNSEGPHAQVFNAMLAQIENDEFGNLKWNRDNLLDPFFLGYIANAEKTGGKFASEIAPILDSMEQSETGLDLDATLGFDMTGKPTVNFFLQAAPDEERIPYIFCGRFVGTATGWDGGDLQIVLYSFKGGSGYAGPEGDVTFDLENGVVQKFNDNGTLVEEVDLLPILIACPKKTK